MGARVAGFIIGSVGSMALGAAAARLRIMAHHDATTERLASLVRLSERPSEPLARIERRVAEAAAR